MTVCALLGSGTVPLALLPARFRLRRLPSARRPSRPRRPAPAATAIPSVGDFFWLKRMDHPFDWLEFGIIVAVLPPRNGIACPSLLVAMECEVFHSYEEAEYRVRRMNGYVVTRYPSQGGVCIVPADPSASPSLQILPSYLCSDRVFSEMTAPHFAGEGVCYDWKTHTVSYGKMYP